jgi:hypothetical protein
MSLTAKDFDPDAQVAEYDRQIEEYEKKMTRKQIALAHSLAGGLSQERALLEAGYAKSSARNNNHVLVAKYGVREVAKLLKLRDCAINGFTAAHYRNRFHEIAKKAEEAGSFPTAERATRSMAICDGIKGFTQQDDNSGVQLTINITGFPGPEAVEQGVTIDADPGE